MSPVAIWMLVDRVSGQIIARSLFGRLSALLDVALEFGRAQRDPDTGRIRLLANVFITLRPGGGSGGGAA